MEDRLEIENIAFTYIEDYTEVLQRNKVKKIYYGNDRKSAKCVYECDEKGRILKEYLYLQNRPSFYFRTYDSSGNLSTRGFVDVEKMDTVFVTKFFYDGKNIIVKKEHKYRTAQNLYKTDYYTFDNSYENESSKEHWYRDACGEFRNDTLLKYTRYHDISDVFNGEYYSCFLVAYSDTTHWENNYLLYNNLKQLTELQLYEVSNQNLFSTSYMFTYNTKGQLIKQCVQHLSKGNIWRYVHKIYYSKNGLIKNITVTPQTNSKATTYFYEYY